MALKSELQYTLVHANHIEILAPIILPVISAAGTVFGFNLLSSECFVIIMKLWYEFDLVLF